MNNRNFVSLIGRIGNDFQVKEFTNENSNQTSKILPLSIAVDDSYFDSKKEVKVERSYWINAVAKNKLVEHILKYYQKGDQIAILGKLTSRKYKNSNDVDVFVTEIEIESIDILLRVQKK